MGVPYQWMICSGASYQNWWSRGTPILGNHHMFKLPCMIVVVHGVCPSKGNQFGHSINTSPLTVNRDSQIPIFGNQKCGVPFQLVIYTSDTLKISPLLVNQGLFIRGELLTSRIILQWLFRFSWSLQPWLLSMNCQLPQEAKTTDLHLATNDDKRCQFSPRWGCRMSMRYIKISMISMISNDI